MKEHAFFIAAALLPVNADLVAEGERIHSYFSELLGRAVKLAAGRVDILPDAVTPYTPVSYTHLDVYKRQTYCVPPFMIRGRVVSGVMSFAEMDAMMYKVEGEDLYLIGTSEHSMIGKFIDAILEKDKLPYTYTSYSCLLYTSIRFDHRVDADRLGLANDVFIARRGFGLQNL